MSKLCQNPTNHEFLRDSKDNFIIKTAFSITNLQRFIFRVRPVAAARVSSPSQKTEENKGESCDQSSDVLSMLTGKPLMSIAFEKMVMHVDAPTVVASKISKNIHGTHDPLNRPGDSGVPTTS